MICLGDDIKFGFKVLGYEFSSTGDNEYDKNFLLVEIEVVTGNLHWTKAAPVLLTWEVKKIAEWFMLLADNKEPERELEFIEPNLHFSYTKINSKTNIAINFAMEFLPPNWNEKQECVINFELGIGELKAMGKLFADELNKFPIRL